MLKVGLGFLEETCYLCQAFSVEVQQVQTHRDWLKLRVNALLSILDTASRMKSNHKA